MPVMDLPSFVRIMKKCLVGYDKQEAAFNLVMNSINEQDYVKDNGYYETFGSKRISRIMSHDSPVPDGTKQASADAKVTDETRKYFKDEIEPLINPHSGSDSIAELVELLETDDSIPDAKRNELKGVLSSDGVGLFLADLFLYSLNRTVTQRDETVDTEDISLLAEANYRCPLCQKPLTETVKGVPVKRYEITRIYPEGLDDDQAIEFAEKHTPPEKLDRAENLIVLDAACAEQYRIDPTPDEYARLMRVKNELCRNYKAAAELGSLALEEEIRTVVSALSNIVDESALTKLSYNALRVEEKMGSADYILLAQVQMQVVFYYSYIQKLFSESGVDFELVCSEVKAASKKLENSGLTHIEVISKLSEWFMSRSQLGAESKQACDIVVAFFIQDCEVFSV